MTNELAQLNFGRIMISVKFSVHQNIVFEVLKFVLSTMKTGFDIEKLLRKIKNKIVWYSGK